MKKGYIIESNYISKDPEKKARQLANLKKRHSKKKMESGKVSAKELQEMDIIQFITDERCLNQSLFPAQETILRALYGLPIPEYLIKYYEVVTGLKSIHENGIEKQEGVWCLGARSGKSFMASCIALYEGTRDRWRPFLRKNEVGYIVIIATRLEQAKAIIQRNAAAMIINSSLANLLESDPTSQEIVFKNGMRILSLPCNSTAGRGLPICTLIFDEIGFFYGEGYVKADEDIFNSLRPRQAQFSPYAKTILISTPNAKQGVFWNMFSEGCEIPSRLTCHASTIQMNPNILSSFFEKEKERDPDTFAREYLAEFAEKSSAYFEAKYIEPALIHPCDIQPESRFRYSCGVDFSGLTGRDRTGIAVAHRAGEKTIVDAVRSLDSTNQDFIMNEIKQFIEQYAIDRIFIDRYAAGWTKTALEKLGVYVEIREPLPAIYSNLKSLLIAGKVELQDNGELRHALENVRAFYGRNNSLSIQHERNSSGHGDVCDAVATAVYSSSSLRKPMVKPEPKNIMVDWTIWGPVYRPNPSYPGYKKII